jgi:hypothetical protein
MENQNQRRTRSWTSLVWTVITFLVGSAFGTGGYWEWQKLKLDTQKQELDTVVQTTDLRKQENDQYAKIIELTQRYVEAKDQYSKTPSPQLNNQMVDMKAQLNLMKDDFTVLETKLARLEGRQPRNIPIDFVPPEPPTGLRVTVQ